MMLMLIGVRCVLCACVCARARQPTYVRTHGILGGVGGAPRNLYQLQVPLTDVRNALSKNRVCTAILESSTELSTRGDATAAAQKRGGGGGGRGGKRARHGRNGDEFEPHATDERLQAAPGAFVYNDDDDDDDDDDAL